MTLATATKDGKPSARMVLLKHVDEQGFVFYTNYNSRKAKELAGNPVAALMFYWAELDRQVRIEGTVSKVSAEESGAYFQTRPRDTQLGALASSQSERCIDRVVLIEAAGWTSLSDQPVSRSFLNAYIGGQQKRWNIYE